MLVRPRLGRRRRYASADARARFAADRLRAKGRGSVAGAAKVFRPRAATKGSSLSGTDGAARLAKLRAFQAARRKKQKAGKK